MDPFHLALALGPAAVYLLVVGSLNFSRRPTVVTGFRDTAALAVALTGLVIVGPIELFMPLDAAAAFGRFVWLLLLALYVLLITFLLLSERPRLVIYNITLDVLRPLVERAAADVDPGARWAGDSLLLPQSQVELHLEATQKTRNVSLVANHDEQNLAGWKRLELALRRRLADCEVPRNPYGLNLIVLSAAISAAVLWRLALDPNGVAQAFFDMLRL